MASEVTTFQSSPTLAGGCNVDIDRDKKKGKGKCSILTHPCGRVQHWTIRLELGATVEFQSSPTLAGGCNLSVA